MYRTIDTYTIKLWEPVHRNSIEVFTKRLEDCHLMSDFRGCCDELTDGQFEFTACCSYKTYKTFFTILHEVFGPFTAQVSFNEDYPPEGCAYNTAVDLEVDEDGYYFFVLLNMLSIRENMELSEECRRRRRNPDVPFERNCMTEGNMSDWAK